MWQLLSDPLTTTISELLPHGRKTNTRYVPIPIEQFAQYLQVAIAGEQFLNISNIGKEEQAQSTFIYPFIHPSTHRHASAVGSLVHPSIHFPATHPFVRASIPLYPSVHQTFLPSTLLCPSSIPSFHLSIYPSIQTTLSIQHSFHPSIHLSVHPPLSVHPTFLSSIRPSIYRNRQTWNTEWTYAPLPRMRRRRHNSKSVIWYSY